MSNFNNQDYKNKWYKRSWFIILSLILIYPIGLALMWGVKAWSFWIRAVITAICTMLFIVNFSTNNEPTVVYKTNPQDKKLEAKLKDEKSENKKIKKKLDLLDKKLKDEKEKNKNKDESHSDSNSKINDTNKNDVSNSNEISNDEEENNSNAISGPIINDKTEEEKEKEEEEERIPSNNQ